MRGSISTCVTCEPSRAKACVSSQPIGPPPSTTSRFGRSRRFPHRVGGQVADLGQPRDRRHEGPRAGGDDDVLRRQRVPLRAGGGGGLRRRVTSTVHGEVIFAVPSTHLDAERGVALDRVVRLDRLHHRAARAPSPRRSRSSRWPARCRTPRRAMWTAAWPSGSAPCSARSRCSGSRRPSCASRPAPPSPWSRRRCRRDQAGRTGADHDHVVVVLRAAAIAHFA
jgi:hypothetical protein